MWLGKRGAAIGLLVSTSIARADPEPASSPEATPITVVGARRVLGQGFSRAEVQQLPGALADPLRAIEALPGVTPTVSGVPYFFVRGAPPGDLGYFYDGIRLPALFHALGGPSVIHPGLIDTVELYPGPAPVEYGRFAGGTVVARALAPSTRTRGELALRATDSSALLDTPLAADTRLTLSGRYSYANPVLQLFAPELNVEYWDYQARLEQRLSARSHLAVIAFRAHDALTDLGDERPRTLYGVDFHRGAVRFRRQIDSGFIGLQLMAGADRSLAEGGDVKVRDDSVELRLELEQALDRRLRLRAGASAGSDRYRLDTTALDDEDARRRYAEQFPSRMDSVAGAYVAFDLSVGPSISLSPGLRADAYTSHGQHAFALDPRVSAEYRVSSRLSLRSALGVAHQPPAAAVPAPGLNPALRGGLQTGVQSSYGVRARLPAETTLDLTLFQTALFNVSDTIGQARADEADARVTEDSRGLGRSRGVELLVKRSLTRRLGGFLSYTLSKSERSVGRSHVPSSFDRRHVLGAALGYDWGHGYRSGVRASLYSGVPADVAYLAAARDPPRTPPFYRLDVRGEKRFAWGEHGYVSLVLEVVNLTLNREVLFESCNAYRCRARRVGPVTIPNLALELGF